MKKLILLLINLLIISTLSFGQSILLTPTNNAGSTGYLKTPTSNYGFEHTDGTISLRTYTNSNIANVYYGGWLETYSNHPLILSTNDDLAQILLHASGNIHLNPSNGKVGNVGIGLASTVVPAAKLDVSGNVISEGGSAGFRFNDRTNNAKGYQWYASGGNAYLFRQHSSPTEVIAILENGNVGIGTNTPVYKLDVAGDINSSTFVRASGLALTSDVRLKRDFSNLKSSLSRLYEVNGYNYFWKDEAKGKTLQTGVIAQELEKIFPELVMKDEKGFLSVNYIGLVPHLIEAIKDLVNKNQELKTKNEQMSATIAEILTRLDKLENNKNDKIEIINTKK